MIIVGLRSRFKLSLLLEIAELARSTFYDNLSKLNTDKDSDLKEIILQIHEKDKCFGYPRITTELRKLGILINHKKVYRLMKELSIKSILSPRKKYRSFRASVPDIDIANELNREFDITDPYKKLVTDVTEFKVGDQKLYLSPVMDLYNREILSYEISNRPNLELVQNMMTKLLPILSEASDVMIHSDQGWHYKHSFFQSILQANGLKQSMSRKGNCLDNAVIESFFSTLKRECFYPRKFSTIEELHSAIEEYIYYYNNFRNSTKLNGLSPKEYKAAKLMI